MKLTYLGTAAAEGMPAVFCNCEVCQKARALGDKNIRTRSQSLINNDLLLDLSADTYHHFLSNGIEGHKIKYLFVTHSHMDHFYPSELEMRHGAFAHNQAVQTLRVFLNGGSFKKNEDYLKNMDGIEVNLINHYETVDLGDYKVTALPARHFAGDEANIYIIENDKTLLYAHDTGFFLDGVFDYIKENSIKFDLISLDCTNVDIPISNQGSHMGLPNIRQAVAKLTEIGAVTDETKIIINHFSHNANPLQDVLEEKVKDDGFLVAFDGMSISF